MDNLYWLIGFIAVNALWTIPACIICVLLLNGLLNTISIHVFYCLCKRRNKTKYTYFQVLKSALRWQNFLEMCFTSNEITISNDFGIWRSKFDFTVYKK